MINKKCFIFLLTFFVISCGFSLQAYKITIDNPNSETLTDFQVKITLNSSLTDFWDKVNHDGTNFRFYSDLNLTNKLPYWVEKWDYTNKKAIVWIKVHSLKPGDNYVYLAITSDTKSESNGDKVFEFFDDFENPDVLNTRYTKTHNFNNVYISNSILTLDYTGTFHHYWGIITKEDVLLNENDYIIEVKAKTCANDAPKVAIWSERGVSDKNWRVVDTYPFLCLIHENGGSGTYTWTPAHTSIEYIPGYNYKDWRRFVYHVHRNNIDGTNGFIEYLQYGDYSTNENKITTPFKLPAYVVSANSKYYGNKLFIGGEQDGDIYYDWIFVRKYADKEPTITNISEFNLVKISASFLINKTTDYYFKFETIPVNVSNTYNTTKEVDFKFFVDNISVENKTINISANSSIIENISTLTYYLTHGEHVLRLDYSYFDPDQNQTVNNTITKTIFVVRFNNTEYNVTKDIYQYQVSILYNRNISSDLGVVGDFTILNEENTLEGNYSLLHYKIENNTLYYRIFSKDTTGTDNYFVKISIDWADNVSYNFSYNFNITNNENNLTFKYIEVIEGDISKINVTFLEPYSTQYYSYKIIASSPKQTFEYVCQPETTTVLKCSAQVPKLINTFDPYNISNPLSEQFNLTFVATSTYLPTYNLLIGNMSVYYVMLTTTNTGRDRLTLSMLDEDDLASVQSSMYCDLYINYNDITREIKFYKTNISTFVLYKPLNRDFKISGKCFFGKETSPTTDVSYYIRDRIFDNFDLSTSKEVKQFLVKSNLLSTKFATFTISDQYNTPITNSKIIITKHFEDGDKDVVYSKTDGGGQIKTSVSCSTPYQITVIHGDHIYTTEHYFDCLKTDEIITFTTNVSATIVQINESEFYVNYKIYDINDSKYLFVKITSTSGEQKTFEITVSTTIINNATSQNKTFEIYKNQLICNASADVEDLIKLPSNIKGLIYLTVKDEKGVEKQFFVGNINMNYSKEKLFIVVLVLAVIVLFFKDPILLLELVVFITAIFTVLGFIQVDMAVMICLFMAVLLLLSKNENR